MASHFRKVKNMPSTEHVLEKIWVGLCSNHRIIPERTGETVIAAASSGEGSPKQSKITALATHQEVQELLMKIYRACFINNTADQADKAAQEILMQYPPFQEETTDEPQQTETESLAQACEAPQTQGIPDEGTAVASQVSDNQSAIYSLRWFKAVLYYSLDCLGYFCLSLQIQIPQVIETQTLVL